MGVYQKIIIILEKLLKNFMNKIFQLEKLSTPNIFIIKIFQDIAIGLSQLDAKKKITRKIKRIENNEIEIINQHAETQEIQIDFLTRLATIEQTESYSKNKYNFSRIFKRLYVEGVVKYAMTSITSCITTIKYIESFQ